MSEFFLPILTKILIFSSTLLAPKCSSGKVKCSFDNAEEIFCLEVQIFWLRSRKGSIVFSALEISEPNKVVVYFRV